MTDPLLERIEAGIRVYDLGRQLRVGMPQSPNHPAFWHTLPRRHGDMVRADGGSAANDMITMGTHVGTHIDALSHVSHDNRLHDGSAADAAGVGGRYAELGIHTVAPMLRRGLLLDVPAALGRDALPGGFEITPGMLDDTVAAQGVARRPGDIVLLRTGWGARFAEGAAYLGATTGTPGVGEAGARWLAAGDPHAVGSDTIAFERTVRGGGHSLLPAHRVLLVEGGVYIVEALDLEELAAERVHEFTLVLVPLNIYGATGSPVRPLAVVTG